MPTKSKSFRIGKVQAYLRGRVWYLCYFENGRRRRPRIGSSREAKITQTRTASVETMKEATWSDIVKLIILKVSDLDGALCSMSVSIYPPTGNSVAGPALSH